VTRVAVASPLRLATDAGVAVGERGGNALDAALTTAGVLAVAYPHNCAIGGDLLALVRDPDGTVTFVNASGRALRAADVDAVRREHAVMPIRGAHPVTVPGLVDGWAALAGHGAALPWADLLAPAVAAAADGVPVSPGLAEAVTESLAELADFPELRALLCPGGTPLAVGDLFRQPALARSLATLAEQGPAALYRGTLGEALCAGLVARGVPLSTDDLRAHRTDQAPALHLPVDGWTVFAGRPSSQAYLVLRALGALAEVPGDGPLHRRISAAQLAVAFHLLTQERDAVLGDPESMTTDVADLLTPDALRGLVDRATAAAPTPGAAAAAAGPDGDTVAVVAADDEGRSVSLIQSLFHGFGSMVLEPTTGILMHDRGACFSLDPASPNVLAPGKRPLHTLSPVLAERTGAGDRHRLVVGTMGGHVQPQILTQVLSRLIDGDGAADAVGAARFTVGAWDEGDPEDGANVESDLDPQMRAELDAYPGPVTLLEPHSGSVGHAHGIRVRDGAFDVGSDPRADG
jgi:gamma-glutamyltranspeptidase